MDPTKVSRGKTKSPKAPAAKVTSKNSKPAQSFSAELSEARRSAQPKNKPGKQQSGPAVREDVGPRGVTVQLVDSKNPVKRTVEITGAVSYANKQGDLVDGSLARAGRVTKTAAVTVKVTDPTGTTKRIYGDKPSLMIDVGKQAADVTLRGKFTSEPKIEATENVGGVRVDASAVKGAGVGLYSSSKGPIEFIGSPSGDVVFAKSTQKVTVDAGAGNDYVYATGGAGSVVKGGAGADEIYTKPGPTRYYGGPGPDEFLIDRDPIEDFDPVQDRKTVPE